MINKAHWIYMMLPHGVMAWHNPRTGENMTHEEYKLKDSSEPTSEDIAKGVAPK